MQSIRLPRWDDLPEIDLYVDQVLSFIELWLGESYRNEEKSLMTKTMVNNYVKLGILQPPVKKRYDRLAVASLFVICILKTVYSMEDITKLIHLALEVNTPKASYNRFCDAIEQALNIVYARRNFDVPEGLTEAQYLLHVVAQSFSCTCFAKDSYLSKV